MPETDSRPLPTPRSGESGHLILAVMIGLTVAAIVWVIRQGKPRQAPPPEDPAGGGAPQEPKDPPAAG